MDYQDAQIAEIYDLINPWAKDSDFYLSLAGPRPCGVLDLGWGTGTLCCALAERGHRVTGVDPAGAMLAVARRKPHAEQVEWVESSAQSYKSQRRFDLVVMTGHAFQILLTDADGLAVLETMRGHLKEGGRVAFETRNPSLDWVSEWAARPPLLRMLRGGQLLETLEVWQGRCIAVRGHTLTRDHLFYRGDRRVTRSDSVSSSEESRKSVWTNSYLATASAYTECQNPSGKTDSGW